MHWSPNFLAVVFIKQGISQQVVTRMQDLASEFSKNPHNERGQPLPHPTPSPAFSRTRGASAPVLGPKPWSPQFFSRGYASGLCPFCLVFAWWFIQERPREMRYVTVIDEPAVASVLRN